MEYDLRKLMNTVRVHEGGSPVFDILEGAPIYVVGPTGGNVLLTSAKRQFAPPLVPYETPSEEQTEKAIQERIAVLFECAASALIKDTPHLPQVRSSDLPDYFKTVLKSDHVNIMISTVDADALELLDVEAGLYANSQFPRGIAIASTGPVNGLVETPVGTGMFIEHTGDIIGARIRGFELWEDYKPWIRPAVGPAITDEVWPPEE